MWWAAIVAYIVGSYYGKVAAVATFLFIVGLLEIERLEKVIVSQRRKINESESEIDLLRSQAGSRYEVDNWERD